MASTSRGSTSSYPKRIRLDTPGISTVSHFSLKILENRTEKIIELTDENDETEPVLPAVGTEIEDIVGEIFFQDNTTAFKTILESKGIVLIVYPPGSGKTTFALLFETFLSSRMVWSPKMTAFFTECQLSKLHPNDFEKFKQSGNVAYIDFQSIRGENRLDFERSLQWIMMRHFKKYISENIAQEVKAAFMKSSGSVYTSLKQFVLELPKTTKTTYLLLDSYDTVYNLIAKLGSEAVNICKQFTKFLTGAVPTGRSNVKLICFGVSPYFAHEFSGKAWIFNIRDKENRLGPYFSYSEEKVDEVIEKWKITTSFAECQKIAEFKYDNNTFMNPGICVSFLRSLYLKKEFFQVNIIPRFLWLDCIFTSEDRDLLLDILQGSSEKEFSMGVSIMSIITQESSRKLYYPLFIFGGFISCERRDKKYVMSAANEVTKCLLQKILNDIYVKFYNRTFEECSEIYQMILGDKWNEFCDTVSNILSFMSTKTLNEEKDYNNFLFGLLCPAKLKGFSVEDNVRIENNVALAGLFPDLTVSGDGVAASWELKYMKAVQVWKKLKKDLTLEERYATADIKDAHKKTVLNDIQRELLDAKTRAAQYASSAVIAQKCRQLKHFIAIFYLNHVILSVKDYLTQARDEVKVDESPWEIYCSNGFFCKDDLIELNKTPK